MNNDAISTEKKTTFDESVKKINSLQSQVDVLACENVELKKQVDWFKNQFKLANQRHFGKSSEQSSGLNLGLFDEAIPAAAEDDADRVEQDDAVAAPIKRKQKSAGRLLDVSKFPVVQTIYDLDDNQKTCDCGETLTSAGDDRSTQVDHVPETFTVIEHITLKYCCRHCNTIRSAKKPLTALPKCMATSGLIAQVMIQKYEQHLPLYRQSAIFKKLGAIIPDNTLGNWVMRGAEALEPLKEALIGQLATVRTLQADETKVKTLKPSKQGFMWGYHSCDPGNRFILFDYAPSRAGHIPSERLSAFSGILQTDGYSGYGALKKRADIIGVGCWDHCRRKFTDVVKVADQNKTGKAAQLLILINQLYAIERSASQMSTAFRKAYRQEHAQPVLTAIYDRVMNINAPPKSLLGVAVTYLKNQWPYLIEYLNHGEVQISNCWIENQIRPFAVGRRNWLFTGTPESANKAALIYSLIQNCHLHEINARKYLEYVLNRAHDIRRDAELATALLPQFIDRAMFL
jgi:transposase